MKKLWVLFVLLALSEASLADDPGLDRALEIAWHSAHEADGDTDQLIESWLGLVGERPDSSATELLLGRTRDLFETLRDPRPVIKALERLHGEPRLDRVARDMAQSILEDFYESTGAFAKLEALDPLAGYIVHWAVIGPFGTGAASELSESFSPEDAIKLDGRYPGLRRTLRWLPILRERPRRLITSRRYTPPGRGIYYHLAQIEVESADSYQLELVSSEPLRVFLNERLVIAESGAEFLPRRRRHAVDLRAGWNRLLVKSRGQAFAVSLLSTSDGRLARADFRVEKDFKLHPLAAKAATAERATSRQGLPESWETEIRIDGSSSPASLSNRRLARAYLQSGRGRTDLAADEAEAIVAAEPADAATHYQLGRLFGKLDHLPESFTRSRSRSALERALSIDPAYLPAKLDLARLLWEDQEPRQAIEKIEELLGENPGYIAAWRLRHAICRDRDWEFEALAAAAEVEKLTPRDPLPLLYRAELAQSRHDIPLALTRYRAAFDLDRSRVDLLETISGLELERGNRDAARSALVELRKRRPDRQTSALALARFHRELGEIDAALSILRDQSKRFPEDRTLRREMARILDVTGNPLKAAEIYRELAAMDPGDIALDRYVAHRRGESFDRFWEPYDEKLEEWIDHAPDPSRYPKAGSAALIDIAVVKVFPDGSTSEYTHQALYLLNDAAKEQLATIRTQGEIVSLRTVTSDGRTMEPVPATGDDQFVMPGLGPGAVVEFAYLNDTSNFSGWLFERGAFFFQDFSYRQPMVLSRYVVLLPEGFPADITETALSDSTGDGVPLARVERVEHPLPGGGRAVVYEARDVERLEPEAPAGSMPLSRDYIPNVALIERRSWSEVAARLRDRVMEPSRFTPELRRYAEEVIGDLTDPGEQARALFARVNEIIKNDSGPRDASGIFLEKAGSRDTLYRALLDAVGVKSSWAFAAGRADIAGKIDYAHPRPGIFATPFLVIDNSDSEASWVNLRARHAPFGKIPFSSQGARAIVLHPEEGFRLSTVPREAVEHSRERLDLDIELGKVEDDPLAASVSLRLVMPRYVDFAQKSALEDLDAHRRRLFLTRIATNLYPGAQVKQADFPGIDEPGKPFTIALDLVVPRHLQESGDELLLRSVNPPSQMVGTLIQMPTRSHPYHLRSFRARRVRVRISTPPELEISRLPRETVLLSPLGSYTLRYIENDGVVQVEADLDLEPGVLEAREYPDFLEFAKQVDQAEAERIILKKVE